MLFLIPTSTDAPLYHLPIATGATIFANILVFVLQCAIPGFTEQWAIQWGTLNPLNCLISAYLHGDIFHLLNNMLFLFIFGLIVEGKIGWWRFLLVYNACAFGEAILESLIMLGSFGGLSLGASSAIFGIMIVAFLWAPENQIHFKFFGVIYFRPIISSFDISVSTLTYVFVALNFAIAAFTKFEMSSAVLHLLGVPIGLAIAWGMLAARRVNCEGQDFISIMTNKRGQEQLTVEQEAERDQRRKERAQEKLEALTDGLKMVDHYIQRGHYKVGFQRFQSLARTRPGLVLDETLLVQMINGLEKQDDEAKLYRQVMRYYLDHYKRLHVPVSFKLAKLLMQNDHQPRKAMQILRKVVRQKLTESQRATFGRLVKHGKHMIASGAIEVQADDD